ncbi:hypothetical protein L1049_003815 [Liquidambar formosana]|uniref:3'-5' exonuclease domain-containing protein n=1 Tax=Liquidambar formosana TaxID=63359 RepID=A0AAP0RRA6_LIQFO
MEITGEAIKSLDWNYSYDDYTVYVEDHRILTITTDCMWTTSKWIKDVLKSHRTKPGTVLVGLCVDREHLNFTKGGFRDSPYQLLQLCIGSQCLLYHFPDPYDYETLKFLNDFFSDPRVVAMGVDMLSVAKKLKNDYGIMIKNPMDLRSLAIKGLRRDDLDLGRYDLDRLAKVVLGKHMDVVRPEKKVSCKKVKYATVDPYLCFLIGSELLDMIEAFVFCYGEEEEDEQEQEEEIGTRNCAVLFGLVYRFPRESFPCFSVKFAVIFRSPHSLSRCGTKLLTSALRGVAFVYGVCVVQWRGPVAWLIQRRLPHVAGVTSRPRRANFECTVYGCGCWSFVTIPKVSYTATC